ncbi:hypothetical protein OQA88_11105 [Cercophora sp. LCS_1]
MEYATGPGLRGGEKDREMYDTKNVSDSSSAGYGPPAIVNGAACRGEPEVGQVCKLNNSDLENQAKQNGFKDLGWKRLTVVLIVEAIALGSLSLPHAFAVLGMVPGVMCSVFIGMIAVYTSFVVGQMKLKYPEIAHYSDAGRLMFGKYGYEIFAFMFVLQLIFIIASHVLTGKIMWGAITENGIDCSIAFGVISAILLFLLAIPPKFTEVAILGYIDFASIVVAIGITIIATGIQSHDRTPEAAAAAAWSCWPQEGTTLAHAFIAICNICFAYSFALAQFSFMDEMHTPSDYPKSILALGAIEIVIYTVTGATIYAFVGPDVQSPALLSAGPTIAKVAFGVALPVIFISGSINTVVIGRYIMDRFFKGTEAHAINTPKGWGVWLALDATITVLSWVIAEAIPFFSDLLAISSSLFISGFTFYFPAIMWFMFIKQGKWNARENLWLSALNGFCFLVGIVVLVVGTYSAAHDIKDTVMEVCPSLSLAPTASVYGFGRFVLDAFLDHEFQE